jgi:hypothetical protein
MHIPLFDRALLGALFIILISCGPPYKIGHAEPFQDIVFDVHQCTVTHPCNFSAGAGSPPPGYLNGFTPQTFTSFYESVGYNPTQPFDVSITGANSEGYVYGHVFDGGITAFDTQFVFYSGHVLCCTIDFPYRIASLK